MRFCVLGPLEVIDRNFVVDMGGPKQRAVLAHLILNANRPVSPSRLIDDLWEDEPPPQALASLQAYVSKLRRLLEPKGAVPDDGPVLLLEPAGYVLRVSPAALDFASFERLLDAGRKAAARGALGDASRLYDEALRLWRGEFLSDLADRVFVREAAVRYSELRLAAVEEWAEIRLRLGHHPELIPELEAAVQAHPLREEMRALLALALYRAGRQADALARISQGRERLAEELGIDLGPALRDLQVKILQQSQELAWVPPQRAAGGAPDRVTTSAISDATPARSDFVGRASPLAGVRRAVEDAVAGEARLLLLVGEAGIGKTRLAREGTRDAEALGAIVLWGRCHDEVAPALWPWIQILRDLGGADADDVPERLREFIDPTSSDEVHKAVQGAAARRLLYESVIQFIFRHAEMNPLVVVLDDLQWADVPSLQLLSFLVEELAAAERLLLIGTYRDEEIHDRHPLAKTLAVLARADATRYALEGLTPDEVGELIEGAADLDSGAGLAEGVHTRTGGNPFFIRELFRLFQSEGGSSVTDDLLHTAVPMGVRDVVRRRLARLPKEARPLLTLAAIEDMDVHRRSRPGEGQRQAGAIPREG